MPKYMQIAQELETRIASGTYKPGEAIPEQAALAKEFSTTRITIQKALDVLRKEGYIYSRQGSGTFVRQNVLLTMAKGIRADEYKGSMHTYSNVAKVTSQIIQFDVRFPTDEEQEHLMLLSTNPIYDIIRLRLLDEEPHSLEYTIMPIEVIPNVTEEVLYNSVYSHIKETLGLKMGGINRLIHALKPDKLDQKYLNCLPDDPVLDVEQVIYLEDGTPFEFSHTHTHYKFGYVYIS